MMLHFPGKCWARILHESSNPAVLAESSRSSQPEARKSLLASFPFSATVFAQEHSSSDSLSIQIQIQTNPVIHDEIGLAQTVFCTGSLLQLFLELADPYSVNSVFHDEDQSGAVFSSLCTGIFRISRISRFSRISREFAECGVDPALSELSAHQMARPGHLRTQAYRSIFSQACDHGFQFSSMSGLPIIQTHESPSCSHGKSELCVQGSG